MRSTAMRAVFGFAAAVISVLVFHQAMWAALHALALPGLGMPPPYPTDTVPPWGVPRIANLCFWGGLYGIAFGLMLPRLTAPSRIQHIACIANTSTFWTGSRVRIRGFDRSRR